MGLDLDGVRAMSENDLMRRRYPRRYGRAVPYTKANVAAMRAKGYEYWVAQPTIEQGHTHNLKFDNGKIRLWISRLTPEDFDGDVAAWRQQRMEFERNVKGKWVYGF